MAKKFLLAVISFYREYVSPLKMPVCRFVPTCSAYAYEAVDKYGAIKGAALSLRRICRCNPWGGRGYDPVP